MHKKIEVTSSEYKRTIGKIRKEKEELGYPGTEIEFSIRRYNGQIKEDFEPEIRELFENYLPVSSASFEPEAAMSADLNLYKILEALRNVKERGLILEGIQTLRTEKSMDKVEFNPNVPAYIFAMKRDPSYLNSFIGSLEIICPDDSRVPVLRVYAK